jgi:hypothetical protein
VAVSTSIPSFLMSTFCAYLVEFAASGLPTMRSIKEWGWLSLLFTPVLGGTWSCRLGIFNIYHLSLFLIIPTFVGKLCWRCTARRKYCVIFPSSVVLLTFHTNLELWDATAAAVISIMTWLRRKKAIFTPNCLWWCTTMVMLRGG